MPGRSLRCLWEVSEMSLGGLWEVSGRSLGGLWEVPTNAGLFTFLYFRFITSKFLSEGLIINGWGQGGRLLACFGFTLSIDTFL